MENLNAFQKELVENLIKELEKVNKTHQVKINSPKRFSVDTINECKKTQERFYANIRKNNETMIKVFSNQLKDEIKEFKKEFASLFDVQFGFLRNGVQAHTDKSMIASSLEKILERNQYEQAHLFIVSKTKRYTSDSRYNYCNDKDYITIYVAFKYEKVSSILESGKEIYAYKVVGLKYCDFDYLYEEKNGKITSTLDELIQSVKNIQIKMTAMAN